MDYQRIESIDEKFDERFFYEQVFGRQYYKARKEPLFYQRIDDKYYIKNTDGSYGIEKPVIEMEPFLDSIPLTRPTIPYGLRGFCFPSLRKKYVHEDDCDVARVSYHEELHIRMPHLDEWEIRMLEDWRLGEEKYQKHNI